MTATATETVLHTPKPRVAVWDNARFLLIVLVVIGHAISTLRTDTGFGFAVYVYIYLFHMPAMILLSGMFSRAETTPKAVRSTVQLLAIWVVWEGIWAVLNAVVLGKEVKDSFLVVPAWTLWFLVTLATMRVLLPYIERMRHPLLVSIALALAGGLLPAIGTQFSAARTLSFLPFFVLGWLIRERGWLNDRWFQRPTAVLRGVAWAVLGVILAALLLMPQLAKFWRIDKWLTWRDDYFWRFSHAPIGEWQPTSWFGIAASGFAVTLLLMLLAAALILALLIVTPRGQSIMTVWGSRTLFVYLLHGPIIWGLRKSGVIDGLEPLGSGAPLLLAVGGVVLAMLLSMRWITVVFGPIIEPRVDWLLKKLPGKSG